MATRTVTHLVVIGGLAVAVSGCATKEWVSAQIAPERDRIAQVDQKVDAQGVRLTETAAHMASAQRALEETRGQLQSLDDRVGQVNGTATEAATQAREASTLARDARRTADDALTAAREVDSRLDQRWKNRSQYSVLESTSVYFDFDRADLKDDGITALVDVAKALRTDPNAIVELIGYTDPRGDDRYNVRLSRERVDAVVRHLVQKHGVDVRRIHAVGLGKAAGRQSGNGHAANGKAVNGKATNGQAANGKALREEMAKSRRVEVRLLAPPA
jgi:outer membrane protein OmpA-like peptidoglycan-associated protein